MPTTPTTHTRTTKRVGAPVVAAAAQAEVRGEEGGVAGVSVGA